MESSAKKYVFKNTLEQKKDYTLGIAPTNNTSSEDPTPFLVAPPTEMAHPSLPDASTGSVVADPANVCGIRQPAQVRARRPCYSYRYPPEYLFSRQSQ